MLIDLADFTLQEQAEDKLMVVISRPWYNGSYTMATKPIKMLELHYTMIQFLIMLVSTEKWYSYLVLIFFYGDSFMTQEKNLR